MVHFVPSAFPVGNSGGLSVAIDNAAKAGEEIVLYAPDSEPSTRGNVDYRQALPHPEGKLERWGIWFDTGVNQIIHPEAFTSPSATPEAVQTMLHAAPWRSKSEFGTSESLLEFIDCFTGSDDWDAMKTFTDRFSPMLKDICTMRDKGEKVDLNVQSFFWEPLLNEAETEGVHTTFHLHEPMPENLKDSVWGKKLLSGMSKVDTVYLHTDLYVRRFKKQLNDLGMRVPETKRFDLGINLSQIQEGLELVNSSNYMQKIPEFQSLRNKYGQGMDEPQEVIHEVMNTYGKVPHRFGCFDRLDPIKGMDAVLMGIDDFLSEQKQNGVNLQENFRFFFFHDPVGRKREAALHLTMTQYTKLVDKLFSQLQQKYPGVIFRSQALNGKSRIALPAIMRGMHALNASAQEGLNLAVMETAYANKDEDTTVIAGKGAGFVIQAIENGSEHLGHFVTPGQPREIAEAIGRVVDISNSSPGSHAKLKRELIEKEILPRGSSIFG